MLFTIVSVLATIMGIVMSLSHFSQAYKIYKRKSAKDISLTFITVFTIGAYVWLAYGLLLQEWPVIISFLIACFGTTTVLFLTLRYR